jgi:folate-binding protein YgfZ
MIVDRSGPCHVRCSGADTVRFLQSTTTANVEKLATGDKGWGAILSPKGRVLTVFELTRGDDHVLIHCDPGNPSLADKTVALLEKYAVMDDVTFERLDVPAHQVWPAPGAAATAWDAPVILAAPPGAIASAAELEIVRIEAGILRYGVDVDEDHFPFETPLVRYLDYDKGCYIGQEPVFRVHSQGAAARTLRALVIDGDGAVEPGAAVAHADRENAGVVTSAAVSPVHGAIALAYLHRTVWAPGGEVTVAGRRAVVRELPL